MTQTLKTRSFDPVSSGVYPLGAAVEAPPHRDAIPPPAIASERMASAVTPLPIMETLLVTLAQRGDTRARNELFARHARLVRATAFRAAGPELAEDVAQDAMLEAHGALERLDNPSAFRSWIVGVTVRVARRRFRTYRAVRGGSAQRVDADPADHAVDGSAPPDVTLELKDASSRLDDLPGKLRDALWLRRVDGLKLEEVALELGVSLATVKRWLGHADEHLGVADSGAAEV